MNNNSFKGEQLGYQQNPDLIDLKLVFAIIFRNKLFISYFVVVFALASVIYSLLLPNIYKAEASLAPAEEFETGGSSNPMNSLTGLAGLAGIEIGQGEASKTDQGIARMTSLIFFEEILSERDILPELIASKGWDPKNNVILFDESIYDPESRVWKDASKVSKLIGYRKFKDSFDVETEKKTGILKVSFQHHSPYFSKEILDTVITKINSLSVNKDVTKADLSIEFLNKEIAGTNITEIRYVLSNLVQSQIQTIMLAKSSPEYLFSVIDPPYVNDLKFKPRRSLIVVFGTILGFFLGAICTFIFRKEKN
tara:strand:- start:910 stop:1836 length:927 start_codon:yes stop_codon:yes gene_type:complete